MACVIHLPGLAMVLSPTLFPSVYIFCMQLQKLQLLTACCIMWRVAVISEGLRRNAPGRFIDH